jgi:ABC-type maltose transport system permease subunit
MTSYRIRGVEKVRYWQSLAYPLSAGVLILACVLFWQSIPSGAFSSTCIGTFIVGMFLSIYMTATSVFVSRRSKEDPRTQVVIFLIFVSIAPLLAFLVLTIALANQIGAVDKSGKLIIVVLLFSSFFLFLSWVVQKFLKTISDGAWSSEQVGGRRS